MNSFVEYEINGGGFVFLHPCKSVDLAFEYAEDTCHDIAVNHYEDQDADDRSRLLSAGAIEVKLIHDGDEKTCEVTIAMEPHFVAFEI